MPNWKASLGLVACAGVTAFALGRFSWHASTVLPPPPDRTNTALSTVSAAILASPVEPPHAGPTTLRIQFGGDVLPHRPALVTAREVAAALAPLTPLFAEADATVVNYETATGDPALVGDKLLTYAAKPDWMKALAMTGVDAISVANNHACDLGVAGIDATLATAKSTNVVSLGAATLEDPDDDDPWRAKVIATKDGHAVCAVAWTAVMNEASPSCGRSKKLAMATGSTAGRARIADAIVAAKQRPECDAVVAIFHGGLEYQAMGTEPRTQARTAAEAGADLVVMHHPHVPSPLEVLRTKDGRHVPLFASLGNLATNQGESWHLPFFPSEDDPRQVCMNAWTRLGVIADVSFRWDGGKRPELAYGYHLVWTENDHAANHATVNAHIRSRLVDPTADAELVARLDDDTRGPVSLFTDPHWMERADAPSVPAISRKTTSPEKTREPSVASVVRRNDDGAHDAQRRRTSERRSRRSPGTLPSG